MKQHPLIFTHIPKTAGSTVHYILDKQYKKPLFLRSGKTFVDIERYHALPENKKNEYDVINGHLAILLIDEFENPVSFTFLRNPIDYFLSDFYYIKRNPKNRLFDMVKAMETPQEFLDIVEEINYDNLQTRHLSGAIKSLKNLEDINFKAEGEKYYQEAIRNLEKIDFVFFTEQFDLAMVFLEEKLNWKKRPFYNKQNKTKNRQSASELSDDFKKQFDEIYHYDNKLFKEAEAKNKKILEGVNWEERVKQFQAENKKYQSNRLNKLNDKYIYRINKKIKDLSRDYLK